MYTVTLDFQNDFDQLIIKIFKRYNFVAKRDDNLRVKYFNYIRRLIPIKPRVVLHAKEFTCPLKHQTGIHLIETKFEKGEDIFPHLHERITDFNYNDSLLNDWGIYHLHLGIELIKKKRFVKRHDHVLFLRVDNDCAYFINVLTHKDWSNQQMVKVIHDNWPETIESCRITDIGGITHIPTNKDIEKLRKHTFNTLLEIEPDKTYYAPIGGGVNMAGSSLRASEQAISVFCNLRSYEEHIKGNIQKVGRDISVKTGSLATHFVFKLEYSKPYCFAIEQKTGFRVILPTINN